MKSVFLLQAISAYPSFRKKKFLKDFFSYEILIHMLKYQKALTCFIYIQL